jgi:hypothetical protein
MIAPNIAIPIMKPIPLASRNVPERNNESGMIGSGARLSCQTNATSMATPAIPSPTISGEPQSYWLPPHVVTRMSAATPPASSPAPR